MAIATTEAVEARIHIIRGVRVMLDVDLAQLYGVSTGHLNESVSRNLARFPDDFAFRLSSQEAVNARGRARARRHTSRPGNGSEGSKSSSHSYSSRQFSSACFHVSRRRISDRSR